MPVWCIPVHLIISIILSVCLYHLVEKPARSLLQPRNRHQNEPGIHPNDRVIEPIATQRVEGEEEKKIRVF